MEEKESLAFRRIESHSLLLIIVIHFHLFKCSFLSPSPEKLLFLAPASLFLSQSALLFPTSPSPLSYLSSIEHRNTHIAHIVSHFLHFGAYSVCVLSLPAILISEKQQKRRRKRKSSHCHFASLSFQLVLVALAHFLTLTPHPQLIVILSGEN